MIDKRPYRGTRDFFPEDERIQNAIFQQMRETAEAFGYEPYNGPLLEETGLYQAKSGQELVNEQVYSFKDRGGRDVSVRPEMTPTLARMIATRYKEMPKPIRWYSIPNLMRYERPQKGRLREHWQLNCDIFGATELFSIIEILQVLIGFLESFKATEKHFYIVINDKRIIDEFFLQTLKIDAQTSLKLYKILDKIRKITLEERQKLIDGLGLTEKQKRQFEEFIDIKNVENLTRFITNDICSPLSDCFSLIHKLKLEKYIVYDSTIVRGMDYYTGLVFEVFDRNSNNNRALCGGGTYANLLEVFGEGPLSGTGFGLGDVTLTQFLKDWGMLENIATLKNDLLIFAQSAKDEDQAFSTAFLLRKKGLRVLTMPAESKFNKIKAFADKKGTNFIGIINEGKIRIFEKTFSLSDQFIDKIVNYVKSSC